MAGLGSAPTRRWSSTAAGCPGVTVTTDRPAVACLAAQYAGWRLDHEGYFAMGSGPGRARIRAEDLYDDLDWEEHASAAGAVPGDPGARRRCEVADFIAAARGRAGGSALTLLMAPTASVAGGVQIAARVVETALHKLHELDFDVRRVVAGFGSYPLRRWRATTWWRSGAPTTPCSTAARSTSPSSPSDDDALRELVERLPASASSDYGEPFGKVLKAADFDFYKIDPLLFSPAQIRLTSVGERPQLRGGRGQPRGAGALVLGLTVAILGLSGGWHAQQLTDALAARGHEHRAPARDAHGRAHRRRRRRPQPRRVARRLRRRDRARHPARVARAGHLPRRRPARARGARRHVRQRPACARAHRRQVPGFGAAGARGRAHAAHGRLRAHSTTRSRPSRSLAATSSSSRCSARWGRG